MALSDKWTRAELRAAVLREIMDTGNRFVSNAEINGYLDQWQYVLQLRHELMWDSVVHTHTGSSTIALTDIATDVLKPGFLWWIDQGTATSMLIPRNREQLSQYNPHWQEGSATNTKPVVVYQDTLDDIIVWPYLTSGTYELLLEYPQAPLFAADTSTHEVPAWTRYSAVPYAVWKCYERNGPIHNVTKAQRYQAIFESASERIGRISRAYWPKRAPSLRPAVEYENRILNPRGILEEHQEFYNQNSVPYAWV